MTTQRSWFGQFRHICSVGVALASMLWGMASRADASVLTALYSHEGTDPLSDDSGNGYTLTSSGVSFVAPTNPGTFLLGAKVGNYSSGLNLAVPAGVYTAGDDFTFTALVRTNSPETGPPCQ